MLNRIQRAAAVLALALTALICPVSAQGPAGSECGQCNPIADINDDGGNDCGQTIATPNYSGCTCDYGSRLTITACLRGVCVWEQQSPTTWLCVSNSPCNFKVRWEYYLDCGDPITLAASASGFPTAGCVGPTGSPFQGVLVFPAALGVTGPPAQNWTPVIGSTDPLGLSLFPKRCGSACLYTLTLTPTPWQGCNDNMAILQQTLKVSCGVCVDPIDGQPL